jgi:hypothetical protein
MRTAEGEQELAQLYGKQGAVLITPLPLLLNKNLLQVLLKALSLLLVKKRVKKKTTHQTELGDDTQITQTVQAY